MTWFGLAGYASRVATLPLATLPTPQNSSRLAKLLPGGPKRDTYTLYGYDMPQHDPKLIARLSRIQGQVGGIARMIQDDRYCIDILNQMQAIKAALRKVEDELLKSHSSHCVADAIKSGDVKQTRIKFAELVDLFSKTAR